MFEFVICDLICVTWCLCAQGGPKSPGHPVGLPGIAMRLAPAASCCWALAKVAGLEQVDASSARSSFCGDFTPFFVLSSCSFA